MMLLFLRTDAYYSVARVVSWDAECKGVFSDAFSFFFYFLSEDTVRSIIGSARMRADVLWRLLVEVVGLFWLVMEEEEEEGDGREVVVDGRVIAG